MNNIEKRGRPNKYFTDEERLAALRGYCKNTTIITIFIVNNVRIISILQVSQNI